MCVFVQMSPAKLRFLSILGDHAAVWGKRQRYARFRPAAWASACASLHPPHPRAVLSTPHTQPTTPTPVPAVNISDLPSPVAGGLAVDSPGSSNGEPGNSNGSGESAKVCTWATMWRYAGSAVLYDLRQRWLREGAPPAVATMQQRRLALLQLRYVQLYKRRLAGMGMGKAAAPGAPPAARGSGDGAAGSATLAAGDGAWGELVDELAEEMEDMADTQVRLVYVRVYVHVWVWTYHLSSAHQCSTAHAFGGQCRTFSGDACACSALVLTAKLCCSPWVVMPARACCPCRLKTAKATMS